MAKKPMRPFQTGFGVTARAADLRRASLPTGSPSAVAAEAAAGGLAAAAGGRPQSDALQVYPWWERPPLGSLNYLGKGQGLTLAAGVGREVVVATRSCPTGYYWCLRGVNIFVQSPTASLNVNFIVRVNGTPLGDPYTTFGRVANSLEVPFSVLEQGAGAAKLELVAVNVDTNGPWTVGGSITGWFTPAVAAGKTGGLGE